MPVTTVDVVTNVVSGVETPKNATCVVFCQRTGEYETLNSEYETSIGYSDLESRYTNRFDDITYYFASNQ
jgi:hypothetical protein